MLPPRGCNASGRPVRVQRRSRMEHETQGHYPGNLHTHIYIYIYIISHDFVLGYVVGLGGHVEHTARRQRVFIYIYIYVTTQKMQGNARRKGITLSKKFRQPPIDGSHTYIYIYIYIYMFHSAVTCSTRIGGRMVIISSRSACSWASSVLVYTYILRMCIDLHIDTSWRIY